MSVWPKSVCPKRLSAPLSGSDEPPVSISDLISVSITTDPRCLESLLEALAEVGFPVNPQIYHHAATVVEFPAYRAQLDEVRRALDRYGFSPSSLQVTSMLEQIQLKQQYF